MRSIIHSLRHGAQQYLVSLLGVVVVFATVLAIMGPSPKEAVHASAGDWTTFLGSNAHTGYNAAETAINPTTASSMQLLWKAQNPGKISSEPLLVNGVLYWGDWAGVMHATNPSTGQDIWTATLGSRLGSCGSQTLGIIGSAVYATESINGVSTPVVYVAGGQTNLYALNAQTGAILWQTNFGTSSADIIYGSPTVYNGSVYVGVSSTGDCPLIQGAVYRVNASTGVIENTFDVVPNGCIGAGVWDTPTIDQTTGMLYFGTGNADPINCKTTEPLGSSIVELNASNLSLVSSWQFTPTGTTDADVGGTATLFNATIGGVSHQMVGIESKDGNFYAFDRTNISAGPLWHVAVSVGGRNPELGLGSISTAAYDGTRLYVAGGNTTINGTACQGSLRALDPNTGNFLWEVCRNNPALDAVVAVPGLAVVGAGNTLIVVNSATGAILFNYTDTDSNAKFWGSATISNGMLFYGSRSGDLFAFGLPNGPLPSPSPSTSPTVSPTPCLTSSALASHKSTPTPTPTPSPTPKPKKTPTPTPTPSPTPSPTPKPTPSPSPTPCPSPTPSPTPGSGSAPVNQTWYFAEGKVGAGFTEYLTIENPDPINACAVNIEYLLGSGSPVNKPVTVPPASRFTESVNSDLNLPATAGTYQTDSAIVSVTNTSTCAGVVAERPMYFSNFAGVSSGSDVLGATHTGTSFSFADVPTGGGYASFLTILNPGSTPATVTASFVAAGATVSSQSQTITVPGGTRGTIIPHNSGSVLHAAVSVTASQPVVVERPTYFSNINAGNAQTVSGASSVVGVQAVQKEWLFAEGYTGPGFQETFVLANFGTTPVTANVVLEFANGHTETVSEAIAPSDQTLVNVNAVIAGNQGTCDTSPCQPTPDVSADITGSGPFLAQRELYFHYSHVANGRSLVAMGGTDVLGESVTGKAAYSFAEGYTNTGYDEWLTVQNPTATPEPISVKLLNEDGRTFNGQFTVLAHSRFTLDLTALVLQNLIVPNDTFKGYEVSLVVQSSTGTFVAERPMYWNTGSAGTQGGSDILGYVGN